jgi:hypothetical protein
MSTRLLLGRASALALAAALFAAPAAAQRMNSFEISGFGGGYFGSTIYQSPTVGTVGLNSAGMWGARLGYNFSRGFGVEFSWSGSDPSMQFNGYSGSKPSGSLAVNNFDFDAMFNFGQQKVWGYFALGLGWSDFSPSVSGTGGEPIQTTGQSYFAGNTAIGMKAFLNPHLAIQLDARYRWSQTNHSTGSGYSCVPYPYYPCYYYNSSYFGAGELTAGLTYVAFKE